LSTASRWSATTLLQRRKSDNPAGITDQRGCDVTSQRTGTARNMGLNANTKFRLASARRGNICGSEREFVKTAELTGILRIGVLG
jgi:hypothetical protein